MEQTDLFRTFRQKNLFIPNRQFHLCLIIQSSRDKPVRHFVSGIFRRIDESLIILRTNRKTSLILIKYGLRVFDLLFRYVLYRVFRFILQGIFDLLSTPVCGGIRCCGSSIFYSWHCFCTGLCFRSGSSLRFGVCFGTVFCSGFGIRPGTIFCFGFRGCFCITFCSGFWGCSGSTFWFGFWGCSGSIFWFGFWGCSGSIFWFGFWGCSGSIFCFHFWSRSSTTFRPGIIVICPCRYRTFAQQRLDMGYNPCIQSRRRIPTICIARTRFFRSIGRCRHLFFF